jgi:hypothetical protein
MIVATCKKKNNGLLMRSKGVQESSALGPGSNPERPQVRLMYENSAAGLARCFCGSNRYMNELFE